MVDTLDGTVPAIVGIDHAFSFPIRYFERHHLVPDWQVFLDDFCSHWPTDRPHTYVDFVRDGSVGNGAARTGERRWRRLTEEATGSAKSVFHFDVQGSVAKSTHAGLPWLRLIRAALPEVHVWPFDGWCPQSGTSVIVEVYPRLSSGMHQAEDRTRDQHDAYSVARWLQEADRTGLLENALTPPGPEPIAMTAMVEGWILGSEWPPAKPKAAAKNARRASSPTTTQPGYVNRNNQEVLSCTGKPGNDHNQVIYILQCLTCGVRYGANGSDIFQRKCPKCGGGMPGLAWT
ncbi:hypothetical protein [Marivita sp. S2033]|uniref:hypothetical protein n=1 Tax=Marivita sp. S2033 TaxID=3373187 RepID=UPI003981FE95